jgi:hypothetical protein
MTGVSDTSDSAILDITIQLGCLRGGLCFSMSVQLRHIIESSQTCETSDTTFIIACTRDVRPRKELCKWEVLPPRCLLISLACPLTEISTKVSQTLCEPGNNLLCLFAYRYQYESDSHPRFFFHLTRPTCHRIQYHNQHQ